MNRNERRGYERIASSAVAEVESLRDTAKELLDTLDARDEQIEALESNIEDAGEKVSALEQRIAELEAARDGAVGA